MVVLSGVGIYIVLLLLTRLTGLRSFSKMSSFDFAITVAFGSIIASTLLTKEPSLANGVLGLGVLYGIQYLISKGRRLTDTVERLVDNVPLLLMAGEEVLSKHLDEARITEDDLRVNLRKAGINHPQQVLAVVLETTGDMSVLKTSDKVDLWLFEDIRGMEKLSKTIGQT
jgi:uncharacterized membrane protein YcaP (DUF421 family)